MAQHQYMLPLHQRMNGRRLSIDMLESISNSGSYSSMESFNDRYDMRNGRDDATCYNFANRTPPQNIIHNTRVVPMLQQESSSNYFHNDSMPSLMNTSLNSITSGVTFYQSTSKFNFEDDQRNYNAHHVRSNENVVTTPQRGIDRSITLPREHHLKLDSESTRNEVASPITPEYSTNSPHHPIRPYIQRPNGMTIITTIGSPTSNALVTPEVTRPTKTMRRGLSTSSIPSMPPLHPSTPQSSSPKRYMSSMSISKSTRSSPVRTTLSFGSTNHPMTPLSTDPVCGRSSTNDRPHSAESGAMNTAMEVTEPNTTRDNSSNSTSSSNKEPVMIDIAPGVQIRLRGADETESAISNGFYVHCDCMFCSISDFTSSTNTSTPSSHNLNLSQDDELYCILDCDYFICPSCLSISPNPISTNANTPELSSVTKYEGGLGLGFRLENGKYRHS